MARVIFSPLVARIRGKTADAVFSAWHGRNLIRQRVVPRNPKSDGQKRVRESMARIPPLWRSLEQLVKDAQDRYAVGNQMSGFNWFAKANRLAEELFAALAVTPSDPLVDAPQTIELTDATGGELTVDWTGGATGALVYIYCVVRDVTEDAEQNSFSVQSKETVLASAGTVTLTLLAEHKYTVAICIQKPVTNPDETVTQHFSMSIADQIELGA